MSSLLARFAESSFWIARYVERAENLARILDVNETFARDVQGENDWLPILRLHCDEELFHERYRIVDAARVVRFYIIDENNPNSIRCSIHAARENARSIRHLISLEMWMQLNVFFNWIRTLNTRNLKLTELSRLCAQIKERCQLHYGIANGTLYRDQIWQFYRLGTFVELCDQITRLVDIKYHALLPSWQHVGTQIDVSQWNALLRSASAYHGYRRVYPHEMTPTSVAGFVLLDPRFPRSIRHSVREMKAAVAELLANSELAHVEFAPDRLDALEALARQTPEAVIAQGLHEFLDEVQVELIGLGRQIEEAFFLAGSATASQSQTQTATSPTAPAT
jgi:uncharacterized alpha-E superfamily protein